MPPKKYRTEDQKRAADAERKRLKRALDKSTQTVSSEWISQLLVKLANQIPHKVEILQARRQRDANKKAVKRSAVREAANILPKRPKYIK